MAKKKKVRMYIPEEDLADILGYWSKGRRIPIDLEVTSKPDRSPPKHVVVGPGGELVTSLLVLTKKWLGEEKIPYSIVENGLNVGLGDCPPIRVNCSGSIKVILKIEFDEEAIGWFKRLERDELEAFMNDFSMVLALKPLDFSINTDSGIPRSITLTATIYSDGYSKDRLMSVLHDVRRSADLVSTIMKGRRGRSTLQRSMRG